MIEKIKIKNQEAKTNEVILAKKINEIIDCINDLNTPIPKIKTTIGRISKVKKPFITKIPKENNIQRIFPRVILTPAKALKIRNKL